MAAAPKRTSRRRRVAKRSVSRTRRASRRAAVKRVAKGKTPKAPKRRRRSSAPNKKTKSNAKKRVSRRRASAKKKARKPTRKARKPKKAKVVGKKWQVFKGTRQRTAGGLTKADLAISKSGKIVSKKKLERGKRLFKSTRLSAWIVAIGKAREELNLTGFVPCKKGSEYYKVTRKHFDAAK